MLTLRDNVLFLAKKNEMKWNEKKRSILNKEEQTRKKRDWTWNDVIFRWYLKHTQ